MTEGTYSSVKPSQSAGSKYLHELDGRKIGAGPDLCGCSSAELERARVSGDVGLHQSVSEEFV